MTLAVGDQAPDFSLLTDSNQKMSLKKLRGKKIVLYFYPKDNTPGCTREACDFRDASQLFTRKNTEVIGISKDNAMRHQKFKEKYQLPFTLLVDDNADV